MPRTAVGLITPARRRMIEQACQDDNARLIIREIPDNVRYDGRIESGIQGFGRFHALFSVFVTPENVEEARQLWSRAKLEAETLFQLHHAAAELRLVEVRRKAQAKTDWIAQTIASLSYNRMDMAVNGMDNTCLTGMLDNMGNPIVLYMTIAKETLRWHDSQIHYRGFITQQKFVSTENYEVRQYQRHATTRAELISSVEDAYKEQHVEYLLVQHERQAAANGITLAWQ